MRNVFLVRIVPCVALFLSGCAHSADQNASRPAVVAEKITRAVYAGNLDAAVADFDDDLKKQAERTGVGALSDTLHKLGEIKSVAQRSADPDKGRYDYDVIFEHGTMIAQLRLDPSGKVSAYRLTPAKS
jgi:hypothetical protein